MEQAWRPGGHRTAWAAGPVLAVLAVLSAQGAEAVAGTGGGGGPAQVAVSAAPLPPSSRMAHGGGKVMAGSVVTYAVVVSNPGGAPLRSYHWEDDLTRVLDDAVGAGKGGDLLFAVTSEPRGATVPKPRLNGRKIEWNGDVPARTKLTFTYQVRVKDPLTGGDRHLVNGVTAKGSNCAVGSTNPKCRTDIAVQDPEVRLEDRSSARDGAHLTPGDAVTYTVTVRNRTGTARPGRTWTADMKDVVDDARFLPDSITARTSDNSDVTPKPVYIGAPGNERVEWTGVVPANETLTFTHRVTVLDPDSTPRGNAKLFDRVTMPGSNCPPGTSNPVCRTPKDLTKPPVVDRPAVEAEKTAKVSP